MRPATDFWTYRIWKHIRAVVPLPGVVTVMVPPTIVFLTGTGPFDLSSRAPVVQIVIGVRGILCIGIELVLFGVTVYLLPTGGRAVAGRPG